MQAQGDYRQIVREHMSHQTQIAIREHCDDIYSVDESNDTVIILPETCTIDLEASFVLGEVRSLYRSVLVRQALRFQLSVLDSRLASIQSAIDTGENMLTVLAENAP